ncbi:hypothetical protein Tco_0547860 [Tanacetum coccineum]
MSLHGYTDDEYELDPNVTLISKLDVSRSLYLHPNASSTLTVISIKLKATENYNVWSCAMLFSLEGRNKTRCIDNTCRRSNTDEVLGRRWDRVNAVVLGWISNSISEELFLGLDDTYMQLRSKILAREPLRDAKGAYVLISSEESHKAVVIGSCVGSSQRTQSSVFNSNVNNRGNTHRTQTSGNTSRPNNVPRPNNNGNRRVSGCPTLVCEHCGFNDHTVDRCFKLIGYPADFGNSLNDNGKGVYANMAGANQYLTYTDKNLANVIDISYLRIKVSHLNGTEASITKVTRDIKFIIGFDESKCFVMSQDLMDVKIMEIGKQVGSLYYFDKSKDQVLSVLKKDVFENNDEVLPCEICQKAKQTREHFPLSEHKYSVLIELVHLDLWGPYSVVSKKGLPSSVLKGKSPYHLVFNKKPSLKHLRVFWCLCFAIVLNNHDKFSSRAEKCVLVGQGLDHVNLFDEVVYKGPDTPNDDNNLNAQPQDEGSNFSYHGNPTVDLIEDDLGHP